MFRSFEGHSWNFSLKHRESSKKNERLKLNFMHMPNPNLIHILCHSKGSIMVSCAFSFNVLRTLLKFSLSFWVICVE